MSNGIDPKPEFKHKRGYQIAGTALFVIFCGILVPPLFVNNPTPAKASNEKVLPATGKQSKEEPPTDSEPSMGAMFVRLIFGTVFVLTLGAGTTYLIAKRMKGRPAPLSGPFQLLGSMPIGRGVVYLVSVGEQRLLVGTDMTGLKSLVTLQQALAIEGMDLPEETAQVISERVSIPTNRIAAVV